MGNIARSQRVCMDRCPSVFPTQRKCRLKIALWHQTWPIGENIVWGYYLERFTHDGEKKLTTPFEGCTPFILNIEG